MQSLLDSDSDRRSEGKKRFSRSVREKEKTRGEITNGGGRSGGDISYI